MKCGSEKLHRKLVEHFELNQKLPPSAVEELRSLLHAQSCKNIREPAKNTSVYRGQGFQQIPKQFRSLRGAGWHKVDISLNKVPLSWTQKESVARRYLAPRDPSFYPNKNSPPDYDLVDLPNTGHFR